MSEQTDSAAKSRPMALYSLSFAAQILVWSGRQWVGCGRDWTRVETEFARPFGAEKGAHLASALDELFTILNAAARRPLVLGPPHCRRVSRDEGWMVRLVSAEQRHESAVTLALLERVLPAAAARRALGPVARIAHIFDDAGYTVTTDADGSYADARPAPHEAGAITIH